MIGLIELRKKGNGVKVMEFKKTHELHKVERIEDSIPESGHDRITGFYDRTCSKKMIETYETQQKEFITWLEDNIKRAEMFYQCHMDTVDDTVVINLKYVLETPRTLGCSPYH